MSHTIFHQVGGKHIITLRDYAALTAGLMQHDWLFPPRRSLGTFRGMSVLWGQHKALARSARQSFRRSPACGCGALVAVSTAGPGTLSSAKFAPMVSAVDSRSLWYLTSLPPWLIPLLLMVNHSTVSGHSTYYWRLIRSTLPLKCCWDRRGKYLSALSLSLGPRVMEQDTLPDRRVAIPLAELMMTTLLAEALDGFDAGEAA